MGVLNIVRYVATTKGTDLRTPDWRNRLARAMLFFIPRASPDHEPIYPRVRKWLVEIDDSGQPNREIGLDHDGLPVLAAPNERNAGFWTDSPYRFTAEEGEVIEAAYFEALWKRAT